MKLDHRAFRPLATFAVGLFVLVACQNSTESSDNKSGPITASVSYTMGSASRLPDSIIWTAPKDSGSQKQSCNAATLVCLDTFHLSEPLGQDSVTVQLWTLGIRTSTIFFSEQGSSAILAMKPGFKRDSLDILLLSKYDTTSQKPSFTALGEGRASLVAYFASLLLSGDTALIGKTIPVGMNADSIKKDLVYLAQKKGLTGSQLVAKKLLPGFDSATVALDVKLLIKAGVFNSNDSAAITWHQWQVE